MKNEDTNKELQEVFLGIRDKITQQLACKAKASGLSITHIEAIKHIGKAGEISMKDLATKLNITPPSTSTLVDILIEKDLIERKLDEDDRRIIHVRLLPKTHKLLEGLHKEVGTILTEIFGTLSETDRKQLISILRKCI